MLAAVVAVVIPLIFLGLVHRLDLYASGSFRTVLICMGWVRLLFIRRCSGVNVHFIKIGVVLRIA